MIEFHRRWLLARKSPSPFAKAEALLKPVEREATDLDASDAFGAQDKRVSRSAPLSRVRIEEHLDPAGPQQSHLVRLRIHDRAHHVSQKAVGRGRDRQVRVIELDIQPGHGPHGCLRFAPCRLERSEIMRTNQAERGILHEADIQ